MRQLDGQVAFITGAGRGIGRAIAEALADAGASVAIVARSETQLTETAAGIERSGGRALPLVANVTNGAAVGQAVREATRVLDRSRCWSTTLAPPGRLAAI